MLYPGFVSGSYESQSPFADLEKTVNWYPEPIESKSVPWSVCAVSVPRLYRIRDGGKRQHPCAVLHGGARLCGDWQYGLSGLCEQYRCGGDKPYGRQ
jgi:hypothetical protein